MNRKILAIIAVVQWFEAQAFAEIVDVPLNQVPKELVGTWKVLNYAEDPVGGKDFHLEGATKYVGMTYVFSPSSITSAGENKCPGSFEFLERRGNSRHAGSGTGNDPSQAFANLFARCKDVANKTLIPDSFEKALADYSLISCDPKPGSPDKSSDLVGGYIVIDSETIVGKGPEAFHCIKRVLPKASLSGAPAVASKLTALNVTVGGTNIATYQYAVVPGSTCDGATYSTEFFPLTTKITASLGADGPYTLCVKGKSAVNDMQRVPTQKSWTKDTVAPTQVALTGTPANPSSTVNLNVTVGGDGVTKYRAALKNGTGCTGVTYGAATVIATPITLAVGAAGPKTLCVKGLDAAGNLQTAPTQYSWTQN